MKVEKPERVRGTSQKGTAYDFWSRKVEVFAGDESGTVFCSEMSETEEGFPALARFSEVSFGIESARMDGRHLSIRIRKAPAA